MTARAVRHGRCLCGAVRVSAALSSEMSACHCGMCRRWSGSIQMGIEAEPETVAVQGPVRTYASSPFAERAWCDACGSALWLRDVAEGAPYEFCPGLFENAGDAILVREVYADRAPTGYALAGDHARVSAEEYEAGHRHVEETTQ